MTEFAANNVISVTTGFTLLHLNAGTHPSMPMSLLASRLPKSMTEALQVTLERMNTALVEAQTNLACTQKWMATTVNHLHQSE